MDSYLVTGGAGFIGSHIVELLVCRGARVRVLDNFLTGKRENLAPFLGAIELIEGDVRDLAICRKATAGVDSVLHQAALASVPCSVEDPILADAVNDILGTRIVPVHEVGRPGDVRQSTADISAAAARLGFRPAVPFEEGLERTIRWHWERRDA